MKSSTLKVQNTVGEFKPLSAFIVHPSYLSIMRPVIIVMVKAPLAGLAKTRLTPHLSHDDAASLALCFVQDVINSALEIVPSLIVAFTPHKGRAILEASLPDDLLWLTQEGQDLGERLNAAIVYAGNSGFSPIVVLGADSPTLPPSFIQTACDALGAGETDVVLGPTTDGGYYLVGLRQPIRGLFNNVLWSTPVTFEQTALNIEGLGLRLLQLPTWYDLDTFPDLMRLCDELLADEQARNRAQVTYRWLLDHDMLPAH